MRKVLLYIFTIILFACAQEDAPLKFYETLYDFGKVAEEKGIVEHTFKFKNTSNDSVQLFIVAASCGCTTPSWTKKPIPPGEEGEIKVAYNPAGRRGRFKKNVRIKYRNLRTRKEYETFIYITGEVVPSMNPKGPQFTIQLGNLRFTNNHISLGVVYNNETKHEGKLGIYNHTDKTITINKIITPSNVSYNKKTPIKLNPRDTLFITFYYDATKVNDYGFVYSQVKLITDEEENKEKTIYLSAYIREYTPPELLKNPPVITFDKMIHDFGEVKEGELLKTSFTIKNAGKSTLYIRKVKASCGCTVGVPEKNELEPGEETKLNVTFNTASRRGKQHKNITIFSNDPNKPEVNLTIKAFVK